MKQVVLKDGFVINVIQFYTSEMTIDHHEDADAIILDLRDDVAVQSGWSYTVKDGVYSFTKPIDVPSKRTVLLKYEFKTLFTGEERIKINMARDYVGTDPNSLMAKYMLNDFYSILEDTSYQNIDLNNPTVQEGIAALVQFKFLTQDRADVIKAGVSA